MTRNLNAAQFADQICDAALADGAVRVAVNVHGALQERNPVKTGHSRSNWIASVGEPIFGIVGSPKAVDDVEAAASIAALADYSVEQGDIHLDNRVSYIRRIALPPGTSPKAPGGFVEQAIAEGLARARTGGGK